MYEILQEECFKLKIDFQEKYINGTIKGLYSDNVIWVNKRIRSTRLKTCILAEELGHHHTTGGHILDQKSLVNVKQELRARYWAYEKLVPFSKIVQAFKIGIGNRYEFADYLGVTEDFLELALSRYKEKYGLFKEYEENEEKYIIYFDPLRVIEVYKEDGDSSNAGISRFGKENLVF
ncbi:ImmA/IrrE family metallo-endopeptidase [Cytobacillus horneckiae]|uniref:ImmA/IrrE family metallo-endopeptidase n=1 Tax=Cytobacillus horneckiae TaxID=549687 RepID=UPI0034CFF22E